jgi:hypothetical protein
MKLGLILALAAFTFAAGCSSAGGTTTSGGGGSNFDPLYTAPHNATATAGDVHGLWGGSTSVDGIIFDFRFKFASSDITLANRCKFPDGSSLTVGATAAARISDHDVTMLESKSDQGVAGNDKCNVDIKPGAYRYIINDLQLTLSGPDGSSLSMVKITD